MGSIGDCFSGCDVETFSLQAHVDLHGLTREEAHIRVETFLHESRTNDRRCVDRAWSWAQLQRPDSGAQRCGAAVAGAWTDCCQERAGICDGASDGWRSRCGLRAAASITERLWLSPIVVFGFFRRQLNPLGGERTLSYDEQNRAMFSTSTDSATEPCDASAAMNGGQRLFWMSDACSRKRRAIRRLVTNGLFVVNLLLCVGQDDAQHALKSRSTQLAIVASQRRCTCPQLGVSSLYVAKRSIHMTSSGRNRRSGRSRCIAAFVRCEPLGTSACFSGGCSSGVSGSSCASADGSRPRFGVKRAHRLRREAVEAASPSASSESGRSTANLARRDKAVTTTAERRDAGCVDRAQADYRCDNQSGPTNGRLPVRS